MQPEKSVRRGLVHRNAVEAMMDEPGTKKIRVLHVLNNLDFGGAESYVYKLVKNLDGRRYESYLAYTCGGPFLEQFEALPVRSFQVGNRALNFRNWMSNGLAMWRLYLFARKNRIDVIHAHMFEVYFWVSFVAALARIPMVRTIHSIFKDVYPRAAFVERIFSHIPGRTIVLTAFSRSELIGFGIGPRKVEVIPNGIELPDSTTDFRVSADALKQKFGIEDGNVVGTVGRLSGHKNHEMFLKAAALVLTEMRGVMFALVGDGPLRPSLESLVRELGIEEQVVFFGWSRDIYSAISVFDLFVLSSLTECAPTVVLESMALGVPVIATAVGGVSYMVAHDRTGKLVKSGDEKGLAEEMLGLLRCPSEARRLGEAGRVFCKEHHSFDAVARKIEAVYDRCALRS